MQVREAEVEDARAPAFATLVMHMRSLTRRHPLTRNPQTHKINTDANTSTHAHLDNGLVVAVDEVADGLDHAVLDLVVHLWFGVMFCFASMI